MTAVHFSRPGRRPLRIADWRAELGEFYAAVFDRSAFELDIRSAAPASVAVDDIESTLTRVWDLGGTIVSTQDSHRVKGVLVAATFRDPLGHLVSIHAAERY